MLNAILRRFIPNHEQTGDPAVRERYGLLAGGVGLALNLLLFAVKLLAGAITGAISVTADAFNNLSDAAGSAVTLAGFKLASQRADERHPFGHGRIEYLAGLAVSLLILLVGVELGRSSIEKILRPEPSSLTPLAVGLLILSILTKLWMGWFYAALGRRAQSPALAAAATDSRSDVLATSAVLAGLGVSYVTPFNLDGWLGLLVAALILRAGWSAARDTLDPLLGTPPDPAVVADIEGLILAYPQVLGLHDLVIHDYGPGRRMMSVHAEVPADGALLELHNRIDHVERELRERLGCEAVIHMDPVCTDDGVTQETRKRVEALVRCIDSGITIHDFRVVPRKGHVHLIFDAAVPFNFRLSDQEVEETIKNALLVLDGRFQAKVRVERSYT